VDNDSHLGSANKPLNKYNSTDSLITNHGFLLLI